MLVGLNVTNDEEYTKYREAMKPIFYSYGGGFGCDFRVSEVLKPLENKDINRVFTIHFPNSEKMDKFFSDPEYLLVKQKYFENSVGNTTILSSYEK